MSDPEERKEVLRTQNFVMIVYSIRIFFYLFILSWTIEVVRLLANDRADYLTAVNHPPEGCFPVETSQYSIYKTVTEPVKWLYSTVFEPPIKKDCVDYFRRTNPMLLYLPRFPQALATVAANFFLAPFIVLLDKFGDALRNFMDKFNVAERLFGVILLVVMMCLATAMCMFVVWSGKSFVPQNIPRMTQTPIKLLQYSPRYTPRSHKKTKRDN
jgi:hypothetical protein